MPTSSTTPRGVPGAAAPGFQLRPPMEYLQIIRERWWVGVIVGVLVAAPLVWQRLQQVVVYRSAGTVVFEPKDNIIEVRQVVQDQNLQVQMERMRAAPFLEEVAATFTPAEVETLVAGYRATAKPGARLPTPRELLGRLSIYAVGSVPMLRVDAVGRSAEEPPLLINRLMQEFIRDAVARVRAGNDEALQFLRQQERELRQKVEEDEKRLLGFRQDRNLVNIEDTQSLIVARMNTITSAVTAARMERLDLDANLAQIGRLQQEGAPLAEHPLVARYGQVGALRGELAALKREAELLDQRYLERHPKVVQNRFQQASVQALLEQEVKEAVEDARARRAALQEREDRLREELTAAEKDQLAVDRVGVEMGVLRRQIETNKATYDTILRRLNETSLAAQLTSAPVRVADPAGPAWAEYPDRRQAFVLGAVVLLVCVVVVPIALDLLDNRLKSSREVETILETNLVGEIPDLKGFEKGARSFLGADQTDDAFLESFRGIYSQITLSAGEKARRAIVVTSSVPSEGKSFVACNLAAVFALHHFRTLMVDCDFRLPALHGFVGLPNEAGTMRWLKEGGEVTPAVVEDPMLGIVEVGPGLFLLRTGGKSRHPTELVTQPRFRELVAELERQFSVVIFDTPPMGLFPDALVVGQLADESLFVSRFGAVDKRRVRSYLEKLRGVTETFLGVVMNRMPANTGSHYYYKGYNYGSEKYAKYYADAERRA